jgi:hypothetical protein
MNKRFEQQSAKLKSSNSLADFAGKGHVGLAKTKPSNYLIPSSNSEYFANHLLTDADFKQKTLLYITDVGVYGNICI